MVGLLIAFFSVDFMNSCLENWDSVISSKKSRM
ncbi:hypothetical protein GLYMA_16G129350v4 [Glycine max]|nr:hypothetical protein GLYMA_16G129350v4 [Glycine max]KAH1151252.1 hypothetical protein GYH30_044969 [Glycine max]